MTDDEKRAARARTFSEDMPAEMPSEESVSSPRADEGDPSLSVGARTGFEQPGEGLEEEASPYKITVTLGDNTLSRIVFGDRGRNLGLVEKLCGVDVHARGNELTVVGPEPSVDEALDLLRELYDLAAAGHKIGPREVRQVAGDLGARGEESLAELYGRTILVSSRGRPIRPKGLAQARYVASIRERDIVFGIGPAGTGKTYLAMAMAVRYLQEKRVARIILTRPAVEAGEKLGFLPGSMMEKVNPYLRPLYDALNDMVEPGRVHQLIDEGTIEVAPLAFMRGRTLNDSFVVLDEAQNTTSEQMKMFLTRLGYRSKAVITGDITQTDLPGGRTSGLVEAQEILASIEGIDFCLFSDHDVVRHPLVQRIIKAYESRALKEDPKTDLRGSVQSGRLDPLRDPVPGSKNS